MRINSLDKYIFIALAFVPIIVSGAVAISTIGDKKNEQTTPTVNVDSSRRYSTNELSTFDDFVQGNYYYLNFKYYTSDLQTHATDIYNEISTDDEFKLFEAIPNTSNNVPFYTGTGHLFNIVDILTFEGIARYSLSTSFASLNYFGADLKTLNYFNLTVSGTKPSLTNWYKGTYSMWINSSQVTYSLCELTNVSCIFQFDLVSQPTGTYLTTLNQVISYGLLQKIPDKYNPIDTFNVELENYTENIEQIFIRNMTYFKDFEYTKPLYTWCLNNFFNGQSNQIFDVAFSYSVYCIFLLLLYLIMSALLFFVKFGISCLNSFFGKSKKGV